ncbi:MAG: hypothetical protein LH618_12305 [Saprospiraceae bacterium]|nr:hypothetical protein [Saprospiraceae bacterium]
MTLIIRWVALTILFIPSLCVAQNQHIPRRSKLPAVLKEVSGMVCTRQGDVWLLNDSHNPSDLFRYDPVQNKVLETRHLPVPNHDWEDLANDNAGNLYIGDVGNNYNRRTNLCIYRYNPATQALDSILLRYPDQKEFAPTDKKHWNFNCEAVVFFQDSLHLFSKNSFQGNFYTKHYVVPAKPGNYVAELRDSLYLKNRVVTGASLSRDGQTLALTSYIIGKHLGFLPFTKATVFYFNDFRGSHFLQGKPTRKKLPKFLIARQYESVTQWTNDRWLVANEGRRPQVQSVWRVKK